MRVTIMPVLLYCQEAGLGVRALCVLFSGQFCGLLFPVNKPKAGNATKLADVVSHQCYIAGTGNGCDQEVIGADN